MSMKDYLLLYERLTGVPVESLDMVCRNQKMVYCDMKVMKELVTFSRAVLMRKSASGIVSHFSASSSEMVFSSTNSISVLC